MDKSGEAEVYAYLEVAAVLYGAIMAIVGGVAGFVVGYAAALF